VKRGWYLWNVVKDIVSDEGLSAYDTGWHPVLVVVTGRCFHSLIQLRSIRRILTTDTVITLVNALVVGRL